MTATISNWWCPACGEQVASSDVSAKRHKSCKTQVEWRAFTLPAVEPSQEDTDGESRTEDPSR